jgi:UDP-galactopyranose mutase
MKYDFLIVGAGFAGAIMAQQIASRLNKKVLVVEKRNHIAGNAYDEYDKNGILIHLYGPHLFHTNSDKVFQYLSQFTEWNFYEHRVLAKLGSEYYPIPINRKTVNKLYKLNLKSDEETKKFFDMRKENRHPINNSEDIITNQVGQDLFEKFFKHYTKKQWNLEPKELAPSVCGRIPVRFNEDTRYFTDKFQFMPKHGYTKMFENILDHKNIEVILNTDFFEIRSDYEFNYLIYTGPIDAFFNYEFGKLPYRSVRFDFRSVDLEQYQPAPQINHVDMADKFTRTVEYKQITGQQNKSTTISVEFPQVEGEPFYPIPTLENRDLYLKYKARADDLKKVLFCGRLAEYQYYNMDQVVANTLKKFEELFTNG